MSTRTPFTRVPLVEPRSTTSNRSPLRADLRVVAADVRVGEHEVAVGMAADADHRLGEGEAVAVGQHERAGAGAADPFDQPAGDLEGAGVEALVDHQLDLHRAHEGVVLVAGVLPSGVAELAGEAVLHALELLEVAGRERHGERVGDDGAAAHAHRSVVVHLADEPATELHRAEAALERAGERALHQALQPAFEPPDTHRREAIGRTGTGWGDPEGER